MQVTKYETFYVIQVTKHATIMIPKFSSAQSWERFLKIASIVAFLAITMVSFAQPGRDGAVTITSPNTVVNCYSPVTNDVTAGSTSVTVNNSGGNNCNWACGELVMLYQAQGASINTSNTSAYGSVSNYNNSGLYEFNYVVAYNGNTVIVQNPWQNNYTSSGRIQLVKIPSYTSLTINAGASIVPMAWQDGGNFRRGGIVAVHCTGTITVNGSISGTGYGFRPGPTEQLTSNAGSGVVSDFVGANATQGAEKGESIAGFGAEYPNGRYCRGAAANGGGGGNGHNAGGGGGSNASNGNAYNGQGVMCTSCSGTAAWMQDPFVIANGNVLTNSSGGGRGGYSYGASNQNALSTGPGLAAWGGDYRDPVGGWGGYPLNIAPETRIFFGGGGGAGDSNNNSNLAGGTGGGIVYVIAPNITGTGTIQSNGSDALNQLANNTGVGNDAPSGGGGGGTVIVKGTVASSLTLNAKGGKGGDQAYIVNESEGPGGGGGGGYIAVASGTPTTNVSGGANGISLSTSITEFTENGATSGGSGSVQAVSAAFINYTVTEISATVNTPICAGGNINFTTTVGVSGGTFIWSGPAGFTSSTQNPSITGATVANTGTYQVIYIAPGGCSDTFLLDVVVNPNPVIALTPTNITCNGVCNGSIALNFTTATTAPYTYAWSSGQTTQNLSGLCAGSYNVTVTDANTCATTGSASITEPPVLAATVTPAPALCNNACNGSITVSASGGTPAYSYTLNGGTAQASNVFSALCDGSYSVTVTDANGCVVNNTVSVTEPAPLVLTQTASVAATCGANNGSLTVTASGGTTAYIYTLNGTSQAGGTFSNLAPGVYNVSVADANGCTANVSVTVGSTVAPTASVLSSNPVSCFGGANGSAVIGVTGGSSPYQFSLNGGANQASNLFSALQAGAYTAQATDANGCIATVTFNITEPTQLTYTSTVTPVSCNGLCDGQITIAASGGTSPYQYSSDNGNTFVLNNPLTNLCAGNVEVVVRDANGCLTNSTVVVTEPAPLTATFTTTDPVCNGSCDGTVTVTGSGGTAAYMYQLNNNAFQASNLLTGVCAGTQTVTVQDANGCEVEVNPVLVDPAPIVIDQVSMSESNCGFNNGELVVDASGPNAPFQFSINSGTFQTSGTFSNLFAGAYQVIAMDALGCMDSVFMGVNDIEMDGILISQSDPLCFGSFDGTVEVTNVNGVAPITFELDNSGITQSSGYFSSLNTGSHIVTIYDAGFCVYTIPIDLNEPDPITFDTDVTDVACNGGSTGVVDVVNTAGGTAPYMYSIDGGNTIDVTSTFPNLTAGTYDIIVVDDHGCMEFGQAEVDQSLPITISNNTFDLTCYQNSSGFIQLAATGGNGGYQYSIDNGANFASTSSFFSLAAGNYDVVVMDQAGCTEDTVVTLNEPTAITLNGTATDVNCFNVCDGSITGTAGGGTPGYIYSIDGGVIFNANGIFDAQCAGSYTLLVQDLNSCSDTMPMTINSPTGLSVTVALTPSTCSFANGEIDLTAAGGTAPFSYSIDNGATFQAGGTFTGLLQGSYQAVIQDANGCTLDTVLTLTDMPAPVVSFVNVTEPTCNSICDAVADVNAGGGTGTLNFSLDGGATQAATQFTALCAGSHEVIIYDVNNCTDTLQFVINEPDTLVFTNVATDLTCFQNSSGQIDVTPTGGTTPYQYSYDNGVTFTAIGSAQFLSAGTYDLVVTDANNCQATGTVTLNEPSPMTVSLTLTDPNCFDECNGTAEANAAGSNGGYEYYWDGNSNGTNQNTNLCDGTYTLRVLDANGCQLDTTYAIANPPLFVIDSLQKSDATCNSYCDGSITVFSAFATQYSLDTGVTYTVNNIFSNLCSGSYMVQAENANGCKANTSISIDEPLPLMLFSTEDSLMCVGDTIPLFAIALGGTAPYTYTWSNGFVGQSQDVIQQSPASYSVSVVDDHGCSTNTPNTISLTMLPVLGLSMVSDTFICQGTQLTLSVDVISGTAPYTFQWNTGVNDTLDQITVIPVVPTNYIVTVHDICSAQSDTAHVDFYQMPTPQFVSSNASGCSPLTVDFSNDLNISNLTNCSWEFEDGQTVSGCGNVSATFVNPGCYDVNFTAVTTDGCPVNATFNSVVCVYQNPVADFSYAPSAPTAIENTVEFSNTTYGGDTYVWNFGGFGSSTDENPSVTFTGVNPDQSVNVCMLAISDHGCRDSVCKSITFLNDFLVWVPNTFTPDGDEYNNVFLPVFSSDKQISNYSLLIFNRWGELLFESHDPEVGWDGLYHNTYSQDGTYTWVIEVRDDLKNKHHKFVGHVNILR